MTGKLGNLINKMVMARFKSFLLISLLFGLSMFTSSAQTDDFYAQYEKFSKHAKAEYEDYRAQCNAEYVKFLERAWKEYKVLPSIPRPKDEVVPPTIMPRQDKNKKQAKEILIENVVSPILSLPQPKPISPIYENDKVEEKNFSFSYMGTTCEVRLPKDLNIRMSGCESCMIATIWKQLATNAMDNTIRDFLALRLKMQLCDWAYLNLIDTFAKAFCGHGNEAVIMAAFIYSQSGYKMRLGRDCEKLYLLYGSKHGIYEKGYIVIEGINYYPLDDKVERMEISDFSFPQEQSMSLYIENAQKFTIRPSAIRKLASEQYHDVAIDSQVNLNLIQFYNTYPSSEVNGNFMTCWKMYADTPMDESVSQMLYPDIKNKIEGLSDVQAVNQILNWVQTAFQYEYDDKVWGHDRAFFAEETLYYPYCDCEDRAILFTRLVRDLLGLKCILVYYPGHLASAVCLKQQVNGDYISLDGDVYTICDPTYIGAPVGITMPEMDNRSAKVIKLL
ncbi:hypothetical protein RJT13_00325 [Segatella copri]|uniref:hypothetical protein n=1 Tax=Segatella copri TaxID=165179 RepID=UPI0029169E8D|nr:hypothetical protein [Segatella copri]MDV3120106.1 hypothetical protein [Segatella copri]